MSDLRLIRGRQGVATPQSTTGFAKTAVLTGEAARARNPETLIDSIEPGKTLGNYLIVSKLGEGGMGVVYKAHDTTLDRTVALKVLSPHLFRNKEFLQRFRIEAQAQARLNGPNIVTLHSLFDLSGSLVLVMEYIEGQTLAQRLHNEGRLSVATTVWVFEQALLGVERAHRLGIVHRDLKPSNIFITESHEIKLMDFGVAKILDNKEMTQSGSMIGTLMYISPEQITGKDADFRSDIYTLGITLFEAVTGRLPFVKQSDYEYMDAHLHEQPPRPSSLQPDIPLELESVILKAIAKDPDRRFQSAHEFRSALIKLGMIHVRAYRRLKAIRKDKDRAVLAHYVESSRRFPDRGLSDSSRSLAAQSLRARLSSRLHHFSTLAMASVLPIAAIALVTGFYYLVRPGSRDQIAAPQRHAPTLRSLTPAQALHPAAAPALKPQLLPQAAHPAVALRKMPQRHDPVRRAPAPGWRRPAASVPHPPAAAPASPNDRKYEVLTRAWGQ
ncbi:MAG: serine/threonine protein kinase [Acidiferrobacterales bacterium]